MTRFQNGQRVQVTDDGRGLKGKCGTVVQLRQRFDSAWVYMDQDLPVDLRRFPANYAYGRKHINLFPSECEPIAEQVPA